ncbi:MAG: CFI-box-CTERM domain-containing protein [Methylophilus sp.]|uniref:CFI-box-CTERM domain-containing protein n=1 Tax=Methylophilus sp. TaxID=29541 RepID=UPI003FA10AEE
MRKRGNGSKLTSATRLSEMGTCERKVYLRAKHGNLKVSQSRESAMQRGNVVHMRAERGDYREVKADSRCFIATCVYGQTAPETNLLRAFRDEQLMGSIPGKAFVYTYYVLSPYIVLLIERSTLLRKCAGWVLDRIVGKVEKLQEGNQ